MSRFLRLRWASAPPNRLVGRRWSTAVLLGTLITVGGLLPPGRELAAQDAELPVKTQWSLVDRILAFDRAFAARASDGIVVGVLHQSRYRPSTNARNEVEVEARELDGLVLGPNARLVFFDLADMQGINELGPRLEAQGVDLVYVTPLRGQDLPGLATVVADRSIPTFTGVRDYLLNGLGIGFGMRGGRAEILVNLDACKAQGMDLDAQFLRLATVLDHGDPESLEPAPGEREPLP